MCGRPGQAKELFQRALQIDEAKLGADPVDIAEIRLELGRCAADAGELAGTE